MNNRETRTREEMLTFTKISEVYPELHKECERQIRGKENLRC